MLDQLSILFSLLLVLSTCAVCQGDHWALIVVGARYYQNYRHQANACHAYHILINHGIPHDHIVTMMYDDVAHNPLNPFPGNLVNQPGGPNVYEGVKIDYRGKDVTAANFLKVLKGQQTNAGSGRVLHTGPDDNIFVYYSDHGSPGFLSFPTPRDRLYAQQLDAAIMEMHSNHGYKNMVFYVEACHSGSMFDQRLRSDIGVYAMTAARPDEMSFACCFDRKRKAFVGDEFSGSWMHDTKTHDVTMETIQQQYVNTKHKTLHSHVTKYGDMRGMDEMHVGAFQGVAHALMTSTKKRWQLDESMTSGVTSWDVPYQILLRNLEDMNTTDSRLEVIHQMQAEQKTRLAIRKTLERIARRLGPSNVMEFKRMKPNSVFDSCYADVVDEYMDTCIAYRGNDYMLKDVHVFWNLCVEGLAVETIKDAIQQECNVEPY